jgi:hypothetical protein
MMLPTIEVSPPSALATRPRLFQALAKALDVAFSGPETVVTPSATVLFGKETDRVIAPSLVLGPGGSAPVGSPRIRFSRSAILDGHLRGWEIADALVPRANGLGVDREVTTLAEVSGAPVWTTRTQAGARLDHAVLLPAELAPDETLRSRLVPGRFFGLLPLVEFIRAVTRESGWKRPPVRASFLMDDPNLHAVRYGYLDYEGLADEGVDLGLHLSVAMIPIDGWFVGGRVAQLFRAHPEKLSLLMHGNNHTRHELGDGRAQKPRLEMISQALRRAQQFETRSGVPIARVMAAPHGECSEEVARDMARLGMESLCITRPFPWLRKPPPGKPLAGWFPADSSTPMPVVERVPLSQDPDELPLRAFLGQPIILYGHHGDLGEHPGLLADWVGHVDRLDDVSWASVGDISRGLVSWRSDGETLMVRPHTRRVEIPVPPGISRLVIEGGGEAYEMAAVSHGTRAGGAVSLADGAGQIPVPDRISRLTVRMESAAALDPDEIPNPRWSPWPITRRVLSEARDRAQPYLNARRGR